MAAQEHPYVPPPYPPAQAFHRVDAPPRHSTFDIVATVLMLTFAAAVGLAALWCSLFFAMAADSCEKPCSGAAIGWAYVVTWGGIAIAASVAVAGVIVAAVRGRLMWIWPTMALGLIVVAFGTGILLADSAMHHY